MQSTRQEVIVGTAVTQALLFSKQSRPDPRKGNIRLNLRSNGAQFLTSSFKAELMLTFKENGAHGLAARERVLPMSSIPNLL